MSPPKLGETSVPGLRGIIVLGANGRIRCAGSLASGWLRKYFPETEDADKLPLSIRRWLRLKGDPLPPLTRERNCERLVIKSVENERGESDCLLLEEVRVANGVRSDDPNRLTPRECEVLFWVAQGKANWSIGMILNLSTATVRKHLQHIYSKLGVENRTAAALCALEVLQSIGSDLGH